MDTYCTFCGEPWECDYVLHEDPEDFKLTASEAIIGCPSCAVRVGESESGTPLFTRKPGAVRHHASDVLREMAEFAGNLCDFATDMDGPIGSAILYDEVFRQEDEEPKPEHPGVAILRPYMR